MTSIVIALVLPSQEHEKTAPQHYSEDFHDPKRKPKYIVQTHKVGIMSSRPKRTLIGR